MEHVFIIAEAGGNHNGSLGEALKLIDIAKESGCDACKFQLIPPFQEGWVQILKDYCDTAGIDFMATPFNQAGIDALKGKVKHWKIASTEAADEDFIRRVVEADGGKTPIIISDGASEELHVKDMQADVIPMTCVVEYPAKGEDYHFMKNGIWGVSDHTSGNILGPLAIAAGATVVEKHFTSDKAKEGPDHSYALNPNELKEYVRLCRLADKILHNKKKTITKYVGRKLQWPK